MGKSFLPDQVNQTLLFPPSLHDWLPEGHLARFLVDVVAALDLSAIYASYEDKDGRGGSAYSPEMMLRVLLYGYATGVYSSRKIEARTYEDVAFRYLSGDQHPDHDTFAEFRKRPAPTRVILAKPMLPMPAWRRSTCTSPRDGISTKQLWPRRAARRRKEPRPGKPCGTSCAPSQGGPSTRCAKGSSSRSSDRSKNNAASGA